MPVSYAGDAEHQIDLLINPSSTVLIRNAVRRISKAMRGGEADRRRADYFQGPHARLVARSEKDDDTDDHGGDLVPA